MYIKDLSDDRVRKYGTNRHDSLCISKDGRSLHYQNLQNGDGSCFGDNRFCDESGRIPEEDDTLLMYGDEAYFNIGGFGDDYEKGMSDTINSLWEMIFSYNDTICSEVCMNGNCENRDACKNLTPDCVKKYVGIKRRLKS